MESFGYYTHIAGEFNFAALDEDAFKSVHTKRKLPRLRRVWCIVDETTLRIYRLKPKDPLDHSLNPNLLWLLDLESVPGKTL